MKFFQKHGVLSVVNTIILVIVIVVLTVLHFQTSSRIAELADDLHAISSLKSQTESLQSQLSSADSTVTTLLGQLDEANWAISALAKQTAALRSGNSTLQSQITSAETQLILLERKLQETRSKAICCPSPPLPTKLFLETIYQGASTQTTVLDTFNPPDDGSISISGLSSSPTGYIIVKCDTTGAATTHTFGIGTTVSAYLVGSYRYSIVFGNRDSSGTITATLIGTFLPHEK